MPQSILDRTDDNWESVAEVVDGLTRLEELFRNRRDDRAVFVTAYRRMTVGLANRLDGDDFFDDPPWVRNYLVEFGELYRIALRKWERGDNDAIPDAWELSFESAASDSALVLQDLLLGVNAHINHDLPFALEVAGLDADRSQKKEDHDRINRVIAAVVDAVQDRIARYYARAIGHLDELLGRIDEEVTQFSLEKARQHAWVNGLALDRTPSGPDREHLEDKIDDTTAVLARIILGPSQLPTLVTDALQFIDREPWWVDGLIDDLPPAEQLLD